MRAACPDLSPCPFLLRRLSGRPRFKDPVDVNVKNANHDRVVTALTRRLRGNYPFACSCPRCVSDMAALALNYLPPHYCGDAGKAKGSGSPWLFVESAVREAIERVMRNPNHAGGAPPAEDGGSTSLM